MRGGRVQYGWVTEVITDGENGRLFSFFDRTRLVDLVEDVLEDGAQRARLGQAARETVIDRYDSGRGSCRDTRERSARSPRSDFLPPGQPTPPSESELVACAITPPGVP